jgi:hypothetical protein
MIAPSADGCKRRLGSRLFLRAPCQQEVNDVQHDGTNILVKALRREVIGGVGNTTNLKEPDAAHASSPGAAASFPSHTERVGGRSELRCSNGVNDILIAARNNAKVHAE